MRDVAEVDTERVGNEKLDAGNVLEIRPQLLGEPSVRLDGDDARSRAGEGNRELALPRSNLEKRFRRARSDGLDNPLDVPLVLEEALTLGA